jgi:hypothetical protein
MTEETMHVHDGLLEVNVAAALFCLLWSSIVLLANGIEGIFFELDFYKKNNYDYSLDSGRPILPSAFKPSFVKSTVGGAKLKFLFYFYVLPGIGFLGLAVTIAVESALSSYGGARL